MSNDWLDPKKIQAKKNTSSVDEMEWDWFQQKLTEHRQWSHTTNQLKAEITKMLYQFSKKYIRPNDAFVRVFDHALILVIGNDESALDLGSLLSIKTLEDLRIKGGVRAYMTESVRNDFGYTLFLTAGKSNLNQERIHRMDGKFLTFYINNETQCAVYINADRNLISRRGGTAQYKFDLSANPLDAVTQCQDFIQTWIANVGLRRIYRTGNNWNPLSDIPNWWIETDLGNANLGPE